jgi:hypothetical protein
MAEFPVRTNADLTIYNKHVAGGVEAWQRAQIQAVAWENRKGANVLRAGGNIAADQAAVYIPFARGDNYLAPRAWQALADKTGKWTLQVGDFIVKGLVEDDVHGEIEDSPPVPAFTISDLKAKYDDVLQVTSVDTMDSGSLSIRHWQLGAK